MKKKTLPLKQTQPFKVLTSEMERVEHERLADVIPSSLYEPNVVRGLIGFGASSALYAGSVLLLATSPSWIFYPPLWLSAGLGGWGLFCIAHDCGHNSFSKNRFLNHLLGQISLFPLLYPFHGWRHMHNMHHSNTNSLEMDTDWRPVLPDQYDRMTLWQKFVYRNTRSWLFWLGTVNYQRHSGFRPSMFARVDARNEVRRSILSVAVFAAIYIPFLLYFSGVFGFIVLFLVPWISIHAWFSTTTMMHHIAEDVPFLPRGHWKFNGSRLLLTTDYNYPNWLHFLTHNISVHTAHHVVPIIPFYNLPAAREALKQAYPNAIREKRFSWHHVWRVITRCHLYDPETGYYVPFPKRRYNKHLLRRNNSTTVKSDERTVL